MDLAGGVARERIRPMATECEQERRVHPDLVKTMMIMGFTTLELPHSWGGLEMPLISQTQIWGALSTGTLESCKACPAPGTGHL